MYSKQFTDSLPIAAADLCFWKFEYDYTSNAYLTQQYGDIQYTHTRSSS